MTHPIGPEHRRQHENIKAVKARIANAPYKPTINTWERRRPSTWGTRQRVEYILLPDHNAHVAAYRQKQLSDLAIKKYRTIDVYGSAPSAHEILRTEAQRAGYTVSTILGPCRTFPVVKARDAVIAAIYTARPELSLPQIGKIMRRDHTSIMHSLRKQGIDRKSPYRKPQEPSQHGS